MVARKPSGDRAPTLSGRGSPAPAASPGSPPDSRADAFSLRVPDTSLLDALQRVWAALAAPEQQERFRRIVTEEAATLLGAESAALSLPVPELSALRVWTATGSMAPAEGELLPLEASLEGSALELGSSVATATYTSNLPGTPPDSPSGGPGLALPLLLEGEAMGAILVRRPPGATPFDAADEERGMRFAAATAAAFGTLRAFGAARRGEAELLAWRAANRSAAWKDRYDRLAWSRRAVALEFDSATEQMVWGDTAQSVFGYAPGAFGSPAEAWAERLHADDREAALAALREAAESGSETRATCRVAHAFGGYRDALLRCWGGEAGQSTVALLAEAELAPQPARGEDAERVRFEAVREIIRALRHEINNPLSVVIGEAQLLRDEALGSLDPALRHSVVAISEESTRINELIRRLSALEEGPRERYMNERGGIDFPEE